jgi:hypothetical protein
MTITPNAAMNGFITKEQFEKMFGISPRTEANYRAMRKGPPFYKIANRVYYKESEVLEWMERQKTDTTPMQARRRG